MALFALVHGGGDVGWSWHLVERELRARGHDTVAPDLPSSDDAATLDRYAATVLAAIGDRRDDVVVVGHSYGGFTAALVAGRLPAAALVYVSAMVPAPGEKPAEWWEATGFAEAVREQAERDGGLTGHDDPHVAYYHDVPRELADAALGTARGESGAAYDSPWPLAALPDVPTTFVLCTADRFFPAGFMRRVVRERLGIEPVEIAASHGVALSRPAQLADLLVAAIPA